VIGERLIIYGGRDDISIFPEFWQYPIFAPAAQSERKWYGQYVDNERNLPGRQQHSAFYLKDHLYFVGGIDSAYSDVNSVIRIEYNKRRGEYSKSPHLHSKLIRVDLFIKVLGSTKSYIWYILGFRYYLKDTLLPRLGKGSIS
jgi:hypothetical protein